MKNTNYDHKALILAENIGVLQYEVCQNIFKYYKTNFFDGEYKTLVVEYNLDTGEENRKFIEASDLGNANRYI